MKKQVLSFAEFVFEAYNTMNEEEKVTVGSLNSLKKAIGGSWRFGTQQQQSFAMTIDRLNMLNPSQKYADQALELADSITNLVSQKEEGAEIMQAGITLQRSPRTYKWLVNGTCRATNIPSGEDKETDTLSTTTDGDEVQTIPLATLLKRLFLYNLKEAEDDIPGGKNYKGAGRDSKIASNFGKKAKDKEGSGFLTIDPKSFAGDVLQIVTFEGKDVEGLTPKGDYGFMFPVWTIETDEDKPLISEGPNEISKDIYDVVLPPDPSSKIVEVKDKPYNSQGIDFFAENDVKIGDDGMAALRSILSEFNTISTIVVNGGASSKPTSRAGGNEKLAKDRMAAGFAALTQMKKDGVAQLAKATITEGKATVQAASPSESDPKNQQVSFVISGTIKEMAETPNTDPVVIKKVDTKMAQQVILVRQYLYCSYNRKLG